MKAQKQLQDQETKTWACRVGESPCPCGNFSDTIALHASLSNRIHLLTERSLSSVGLPKKATDVKI